MITNLDFMDPQREEIMKEHCMHRFTSEDGLSVTIHETDYGNFQVRERALMGNGKASWFLREISKCLDDAVKYCQLYYFDHGAPNPSDQGPASAGPSESRC